EGSLHDRQAHAPGGLLVQLPAVAGRERVAGVEPLSDLGLRVATYELEGAFPRILGCLCVLGLLAVEEAVRRAVIGDQLVRDAGCGESLGEATVVLGGDGLVVAGLEGEDRGPPPGRPAD